MAETYYCGIDLGTSRTSIATSTGVRLTTDTVVGYSKDLIATKRFGVNHLFGKDAIENRLSLDMIWPLADGVIQSDAPKAIETVKLILEESIRQAIPDKKPEDKLFVAVGVPAQASMQNKTDIVRLSKKIMDKLLIVSEPFAVAYGLNKFDEVLIVDLGAGTVDLVRIAGSFPTKEDQITLTTAGNFLDSTISEAILKKYPNVQLTKQIIKKVKEKHGFVSTSEKIVVTLTEAGKPKQFDITDILQASCVAMTDPICKSVQNLIADFDPEFQEKLRNNIIVAGGGSRLRGIDVAIEKGLIAYGGGEVTTVQDAEFAGAEGSLKMALELPNKFWQRI